MRKNYTHLILLSALHSLFLNAAELSMIPPILLFVAPSQQDANSYQGLRFAPQEYSGLEENAPYVLSSLASYVNHDNEQQILQDINSSSSATPVTSVQVADSNTQKKKRIRKPQAYRYPCTIDNCRS